MHNIKVVDLEKLNNFHVGHFFILALVKKLSLFYILVLGIFRYCNQAPFLLSPCSPASRAADSATPPAAALGRPRPSSTLPPLHVAPPQASRPTVPSRWSLHPSPRPRRSFARPPPRRRRGEPAAAPRTPNSRALRNPEHRSLLFPSLVWPLAAPEAQNSATVRSNPGSSTSPSNPPLSSSSAHADTAFSTS